MLVKNFLIVNPETPTTFWDAKEALRYLGVKSAHSSLTLITLAPLLPKDRSVRLVDMNTDALTDEDIRWADAIMLTGMIIHRKAMAETLARLRALGKTVIVGGPFATAMPNAPELKDASSIFAGEAIDDIAFGHLIDDLDHAQLKRRYRAAPTPDIAKSPIPRFDLLDFRKFSDPTMQATLGCPFHCEFCQVRELFGPPRVKKPSQVIAELDALRATGYRGSVFFVDDNFIGNEKEIRPVIEAIIVWQREHGSPFSFYTQADARLAEKEDLAKLMIEAGFYSAFIGLESPSAEALRGMLKFQNTKIDAVQAAAKLRRLGLMVHVGLILGTDADGHASFDAMTKFVEEVGATRSMLGICVATPGTDLYRRLEQEGRIIVSSSVDQFERPNFRPRHMTAEDLVRGHRRVFADIYEPKAYFRRALKEVSEWGQPHFRRPKPRELRAASLSIVFQGIFSPYRVEYWRFMLKVFLKDPRKIGRAFAIAIMFAHFYRYARKLSAELGKTLERIGGEEAAA